MFIPNCVAHKETEVLRTIIIPFWVEKFEIRDVKQLRFYAVNQQRGRAYTRHEVVTIPVWVFKNMDHLNEYVIHELSHIEQYQKFDFKSIKAHGPEFFAIFKRVCPQEWWHYEEDYKPQQFKAAGMHLPDLF